MCQIPKIPKILSFLHGVMETSRLTWRNLFGHWSTKSTFFCQNVQNAPGQLGLSKSQTRSKSSQNNIFYGFTSNPSYSETFVNFNQVWLEVDSWWVSETLILIWPLEWVETNSITMIIKFSFQRLFMGQNGSQNSWISNLFSVLETRHPELSSDTKTNPIQVREGLQLCVQSWIR